MWNLHLMPHKLLLTQDPSCIYKRHEYLSWFIIFHHRTAIPCKKGCYYHCMHIIHIYLHLILPYRVRRCPYFDRQAVNQLFNPWPFQKGPYFVYLVGYMALKEILSTICLSLIQSHVSIPPQFTLASLILYSIQIQPLFGASSTCVHMPLNSCAC